MRGFRTVSDAFEKMNASYRREALYLIYGEDQRTVQHPMDHETMLLGIDVRDVEAPVRSHIMERGWRDNPYRLGERSHYVKRKPKGVGRRPSVGWLADGSHEAGALAIGNQFFDIFFEGRSQCRRLAARGPDCSSGQTGHCGATFQESPSIRFFRIHASLLRR